VGAESAPPPVPQDQKKPRLNRDKLLDMHSNQSATAQQEGTKSDVSTVNAKQKHYQSYLDFCPITAIRKFLTQIFSS